MSNQPKDGPNFIDAQLAYARSKQSKQQKRKREYYQTKHWQTKQTNSKQVIGGDNDK